MPAAVSAGGHFTLALKADGTVSAWGEDHSGQLGAGRRLSSANPLTVDEVSGISKVSAGPSYTLAVKNDGTVLAWGRKSLLGDGSESDRSIAAPIPGLTSVVEVSTGNYQAAD